MTATAQRLVQEIRNLQLPDLLEVREQVNKLAGENPPPGFPAPLPISDEEFEAALNEVIGCTAGSNSMERLLNERRQELQREEAFLHDRVKERTGG